MKSRELERRLAAHGCEVLREGANHTIWHDPTSDLRTPVPRHREIPTGTARDLPTTRVDLYQETPVLRDSPRIDGMGRHRRQRPNAPGRRAQPPSMLIGRVRALLTCAVVATAAVLLAHRDPAAVGSTHPACPPTNATKVFAHSTYGAVFRQHYDGVGLRSCSRDGKAFYEAMSSTDSEPQVASIDIGGRFFAYAVAVCDTVDPCLTNIRTNTLGGYRRRSAGTILASTPPVSPQVQVTRLRIAATQALAWIVCEGGPFGRTPAACLRDGQRRWLYARPASQAFQDLDPALIAIGRHIDARFLKLSRDGTKVTWRQQRNLHTKNIGK